MGRRPNAVLISIWQQGASNHCSQFALGSEVDIAVTPRLAAQEIERIIRQLGGI
jgi:hypothetical protein